ncbi:hypothetical protein [Streptomyces sp. NPDC093970]|uniref:hypothetical protein n=1 Tax=Streptomyces sp. NPDC093970 TaxID=3155076 RepID=UPI0034354FB2
MDPEVMTPEAIASNLKRTIKHGARAAELHAQAPGLVDMLCPPEQHGVLSDLERAVEAESYIRHACNIELDGPTGRALLVLLALAPGTAGVTLEMRQYNAGTILRPDSIQADTVRRPYIRDRLLNGLAVELYRMCKLSEAA